MKFAELTDAQMCIIENYRFNKHIIKAAEIEMVKIIFGLDYADREGVRAIRNAVVKITADQSSAARAAGDLGEFRRYRTAQSAITCAIDSHIAKRWGIESV